MTEQEWVAFISHGVPSKVSVTRLDPALCRFLKADSNLVRVGHDYTLKMIHKHRLLPSHFPMLRIAIDQGMVIAHKPRQLTFLFHDRAMFGSWFQVGLKSTLAGDEIWVMTFHKSRPDEVNRLRKRAELIRPFKW